MPIRDYPAARITTCFGMLYFGTLDEELGPVSSLHELRAYVDGMMFGEVITGLVSG